MKNESEDTIPRDFKGIWIPREIWLNRNISAQAKFLWSEIDSLFCAEKGGCYATNEYLANFMGLKPKTIRDLLKELRDNNLLIDVSFDGRLRIIKAIITIPQSQTNNFKNEHTAYQTGGIPPPPQAENRLPPHIHREIYIRDNNTPPTPINSDLAAARGVCLDDSSKPEKAKTKSPTKTRLEKVSLQAKELFPKFVAVIQNIKPNYVVKEELNMLESIDQMLKEKRTPEEILEVLEWALNDNTIRGNWNGWSSKVMCRNPAAYLCNKFDQIQISSKAKRERKFSPSSNDEEALKKIQSLKKNAL